MPSVAAALSLSQNALEPKWQLTTFGVSDRRTISYNNPRAATHCLPFELRWTKGKEEKGKTRQQWLDELD